MVEPLVEPALRLRAALTIVEMEASDAGVLPVLDEGLRSDDREARLLAIDLFTRLGARAEELRERIAALYPGATPDHDPLRTHCETR